MSSETPANDDERVAPKEAGELFDDEDYAGSYVDLRLVRKIYLETESGQLVIETIDRAGDPQDLTPSRAEMANLLQSMGCSARITVVDLRHKMVDSVLVVRCFPHSMNGPKITSQLQFDGSSVSRDRG